MRQGAHKCSIALLYHIWAPCSPMGCRLFLFLIDPNNMHPGALERFPIKQTLKQAREPEQQRSKTDVRWITIQDHLLFLEADGEEDSRYLPGRVDLVAHAIGILLLALI